ncbi:MAG: hypothetical protein ABJL67_09800 [Sulfitobacter sp.]
MISEGEKEEIRSLIKVARNRTLNFGICMGEKPIETVFLMHRRKIPAALGREARADGTTPKIAKGTLAVEGRMIRLTCDGNVPSGLAKNVKKYLKIMKLNFKVEIADNDANLLQVEDDEQETPPQTQANDASPSTPDTSPTSEQDRFRTLAEQLVAQIEEIEGSDHPKAKKIAAIWKLATKRAQEGDFNTAIKALTALPAHL